MPPTLVMHAGGIGQDWDAGERLMNDVYELIRSRLPGLAYDDPVREIWAAALPEFGRLLGRPRAVLIKREED